VGIVSLVFALLWALTLLMNNVVAGWLGEMAFMQDIWPFPGNLVATLGLASSLVMAHLASRLSGQAVLLDVGDGHVELLHIDPALERKQIERVQALRGRRDAAAADAAVARLKADAAVEDRNLMPAIVDASKAYVTMGEMCDALRDVWGTWRETPVF
jgi:hypothetical protein